MVSCLRGCCSCRRCCYCRRCYSGGRLGCRLRRFHTVEGVVYGCIVVCTGGGSWLPSSVIDRLRWPCYYGLLCLLVFFALGEVGALPSCLTLVWSAEVIVYF